MSSTIPACHAWSYRHVIINRKSQRRLIPISPNDAKPIVSQVNNSAYAQVWRKLVGI